MTTTVNLDAYPALRDFLAKVQIADAEPLLFERSSPDAAACAPATAGSRMSTR